MFKLKKLHKNKRTYFNKKAFEMSFTWIFAIIVGAFILFLAIYGASKFVQTRRYEIDTATAAKISILLDPLETSIESGKSSVLKVNKETRVYNECFDYGNFGKQELSTVTKSGIGGDWQEPGGNTNIYNKYIFSDNIEQGKEFSVFVKPFEFPFKISDLIFLTSKEHCFINTPENIKEDVEDLALENIKIKENFEESEDKCSEYSQKVCFSSGSVSNQCDVVVYGDLDYGAGRVVKNGKTMYYTGPLLYGAIFASPELYECNVKRLMLRIGQLSRIYRDKIKITQRIGCDSLIDADLSALISLTNSFKGSEELSLVQMKINDIEDKNEVAVCKIY